MITYIVDSFSNVPFKGNPAGVCLQEGDLNDHEMLLIAQELNLSETAFIRNSKEDTYTIRFFSPKMEIPLCGHATLASAKVLFSLYPTDTITFVNIQGIELVVKRLGSGQITMKLPLYETKPAKVSDEILHGLGLKAVTNVEYNQETNIILLEVKSTKTIKDLNPDFNALLKAPDPINGVLVTAPSKDDNFDFHSRYFWPWSGSNEDPVTGGTHTFLAPYWAKRLGKTELKSYQSSVRTGNMSISILSDKSIVITADATIIFKGKLLH